MRTTLIGRMLGIGRPPIDTYVRAETPVFSVLLAALVTVPAQGLQGTKPEEIPLSTMRLDVIGDHRSDDQTFFEAVRT